MNWFAAILVALYAVTLPLQAAERPGPPEPPKPRVFEYIPGVQMPPREVEILAIFDEARLRYEAARSATQRADIRLIMEARLQRFMEKSQEAKEWYGRVKTTRTTEEGDTYLAIEIAPNVILSTFPTRLADRTDLTLIREFSPIMETVRTLSVGQVVAFDATMLIFDISDNDDMIQRPFIIARFRAVKLAEAP